MSTLAEIKQQLNREDIATVLNCLGYEVNRTWQFKLRAEEKTPSASISSNCYLKDFGTDWSGDIFDLLQRYNNMTLQSAKEYVAAQLGITLDNTYRVDTSHKVKPTTREITESVQTEQLQREWDDFEELTFKKHKKELLEIAPAWVFKTVSEPSLKRFREQVKFDTVNNSVVIRMEDDGVIYSYKHRTKKGKNGKWLARYQTKANSKCLINVTHNDPCRSLFVLEGVHDYATALLLGLNCIAIPYAGYRKFSEKELSILNGRAIKFMPDTDKAGIESARRLANQIETGEVVIFHLKLLPFVSGDKVDFSDTVEAFNNMDKAYFLGCLEYYSDMPIHSGNGKEVF